MVYALEQAWQTLRFQQPNIAAVALDGGILEYHVPDVYTLDHWSQETFKVLEGGYGDTESFVMGIVPTRFATLTYFSYSSELVLHTPHRRSDNIGVLHMIDTLLELASRPSADIQNPHMLSWGEETSRLAPSVEVVLNMPVEPTLAIKKLAQEYTKTFYPAADSVGLPYIGDLRTILGSTQSLRITLSEAKTTDVMIECKKRGLSVTSAVHANLASQNMYSASGKSEEGQYTSTIRFALRPYLPEPYSTRAYGSCLYTTGWMKSVPYTDFWREDAETYDDIYGKGLSKEFLEAHRQYALSRAYLIRNMPQTNPPLSQVDISSVGIAEVYLRRTYGSPSRKIEVFDVSVAVESLPWHCMGFLDTPRSLEFELILQ